MWASEPLLQLPWNPSYALMIPVAKLQPFITFSPAQCDWALLETHIAVDFQAAAWPLAHWHSRVIGRADILGLFLFPLMTFLFLLSNTSPLLFTFYSRLLLRIELCWNQNKTKNQSPIRVQSIPPAIAKLTLIGIDCSLSHSMWALCLLLCSKRWWSVDGTHQSHICFCSMVTRTWDPTCIQSLAAIYPILPCCLSERQPPF